MAYHARTLPTTRSTPSSMNIEAPAINNFILHGLPPAQLWIGNHQDLSSIVIDYLQRILCNHNGCGTCTTCRGLRMQQYYATTWLYPEKLYTLEQLSIIGQTLAFSLEGNAHHFFIIQKAECLTPTGSNSLLKSIEEPPRGYHFILLTDRPGELLPTIRSRCVIQSWHMSMQTIPYKNLFDYFTATKPVNPAAFLKELEQAKINERDSLDLLDQLLMHWVKIGTHALINNNSARYQHAERVVNVLQQAILTPPMPGSSTLFWKNLMLQLQSQ